MTEKTIDWLNLNRYRAYPFMDDTGLIYNAKRIPDCVVLDCQVFDTRRNIGIQTLVFTKFIVEQSKTTVFFSYGDIDSQYVIQKHGQGSDSSYADSSSSSSQDIDYLSGDESFVKVSGKIFTGMPEQFVYVSLTFSSHERILQDAGTGIWIFNGTVLPTKVICSQASGVQGIKTSGSRTVHSAGVATGVVKLVDGYRTQPIITNGSVVVRVGSTYGYDPCIYSEESSDVASDSSSEVYFGCKDQLFFFCGQNAINSGDVALRGGTGVNVTQGQLYTARYNIYDTYGNIGIAAGESVPCVEISATTDLLNIYRPTIVTSDSCDSSCDSGSS